MARQRGDGEAEDDDELGEAGVTDMIQLRYVRLLTFIQPALLLNQ